MKITFDLDLTKREDRDFVASLINSPSQHLLPEGLQIHDDSKEPTPITMWCPDDKVDQAMQSINLSPDAGEVKHESTDATEGEVASQKVEEILEDVRKKPKTKRKPKKVVANTTEAPAAWQSAEVVTPDTVEGADAAKEKPVEPVDNSPSIEKKKPTELGMKIRDLMLQASKVEGVTIEDAKKVVKEAVGVTVLKNMPADKAPAAIAALEEFIAAKGIK